ncbi:IS66 family insertion sequence element accessory protein TnpB [PVC group bacterium]|nr:IS66 family insertion sequence element accessory protein TnpB [PVC group bacterium]
MMRPREDVPQVYLGREPVDMRKAINGLAIQVEAVLSMNPFEPHLFAFCNRRRDKVKILYFEGNGFVVWYKRLEKQRFHWPVAESGDVITLSGRELNWLLDGYDLSQLRPHKKLRFRSVI